MKETNINEKEIIKWSNLHKLFFQFTFVYFTLYILRPIFDSLLKWLVPWVGENVLHLWYEITVLPNGSGDTTYNYVEILILIVCSTILSLLWTIIDHKRKNYEKLNYFFKVLIRFYLGFTMISYGFSKVIKTQFSFPGLQTLIQPYGDSSPMGLAWNFMGYSKGYNLFTGFSELIGGIMMFYQKTVLPGAFILAGVMTNVFMLNMFYDIPVKLFSFHLLMMSLILIVDDLKRLIDFFVLNREANPKKYLKPFKKPIFNKITYAFKTVILGLLILNNYNSRVESYKEYGDQREKPPLYGLYDVEKFIVDGNEKPPLKTDKKRWDNLIIEWKDYGTIRMMDGKFEYLSLKVNKDKGIIAYSTNFNKNSTYSSLLYKELPDNRLSLKGNISGEEYEIILKKKNLDDFLLIKRGFNWVNEYPYNR